MTLMDHSNILALVTTALLLIATWPFKQATASSLVVIFFLPWVPVVGWLLFVVALLLALEQGKDLLARMRKPKSVEDAAA